MATRLHVVVDQPEEALERDIAWAAQEMTVGLAQTTPAGCRVEALVPAGETVALPASCEVRELGKTRRELASSWQLGFTQGTDTGLVHATGLLAPLARRRRNQEVSQTTVTVWDLTAWEHPELLTKAQVTWQRGMLRRAAKYADAIIVPTHSMVERITDLASLKNRVRVISGAAPTLFSVPSDEERRRADLLLPDRYIILTGTPDSLVPGFRAAAALGVDAVVLDVLEGNEPAYADAASAAGLPEQRAHMRGALHAGDRAAVLSGASVFVATGRVSAWPWRVIEAMTLGLPVVALDTPTHRDVIDEGGLLVNESDLTDATVEASGSDRLGVLAADRARAFSWGGSAERVWLLHADL